MDSTPNIETEAIGAATSNHVYVKSQEYGWAPARLVEVREDEADVRVHQYRSEQQIVSDGGRSALRGSTITTVKLSDYENKALPLQNVNEKGILQQVEDMVDLPFLHEAAILYNLKARHVQSLPYTRTGDIVVAVNPYTWIHGLYSEKRRKIYSQSLVWEPKGAGRKQLAPHVYEVSALAYRGLALEQRDQSILVSGESGAGKTETVKICLNHIASIQRGQKQTSDESFTSPIVQRVLDSNPLLEAFGNAKTTRNDNSSRFGKYIQLQFDGENPASAELQGKIVPSCTLAGSQCEVYLLEKSRVVSHNSEAGERTYHIFYQLLAASESCKTEIWHGLRNSNNESFNYVGWTNTKAIEGQSDGDSFSRTVESLGLIGVQGESYITLFRSICAVLQLGNIVFEPSDGDFERAAIASTDRFQALAELIGVDSAALHRAFTEREIKARGEVMTASVPVDKAKDACDAFAKEVYNCAFLWLVRRINEATSAEKNYEGSRTTGFGSIGLLDIFGFERFEVNGFEQLCINYANERLQQKFTQDVFTTVMSEYKFEGIELGEIMYDDNTDVLDLVEGRTGLLAMLNEECMRPNGNDEMFVRKAKTANKSNDCMIVEKMFGDREFGIRHYAGIVVYNSHTFVSKNTDQIPTDLLNISKSADNEIISKYLSVDKAIHRDASNPVAGVASKRLSSNIVGITVWTKFRIQLNTLMGKLEQTQTRYIRCIKPNTGKQPLVLEHISTVQQLRCAGVVAAVTISRSAFPNRLDHHNVLYRFKSLWPKGVCHENSGPPQESQKYEVNILLTHALKELEAYTDGQVSKGFVNGHTRAYFRAGALELLETKRLNGMSCWATDIQKFARGSLQRKKFLQQKDASIEIAAGIRCFVARRKYEKKIKSVVAIQCRCRCILSKRNVAEIRVYKLVAKIQVQWRIWRDMASLRKSQKAATCIQCIVRGFQQTAKYKKGLEDKKIAASMALQMEKMQKELELAQERERLALEKEQELARKQAQEQRDLEEKIASQERQLALERAKEQNEIDRKRIEEERILAFSAVQEQKAEMERMQRDFEEDQQREKEALDRDRELARKEVEEHRQRAVKEAEERMALQRKQAEEERERVELARKEFEESQERQKAELLKERELALLQAAEEREAARQQAEKDKSEMERAQKEFEETQQREKQALERERELARQEVEEHRQRAAQEAEERLALQKKQAEEERDRVELVRKEFELSHEQQKAELLKERELALSQAAEAREVARRQAEKEKYEMEKAQKDFDEAQQREKDALERERDQSRREAEEERNRAAREAEERMAREQKQAEEERQRMEIARREFEDNQARQKAELLQERQLALLKTVEEREIARQQAEKEKADMERAKIEFEAAQKREKDALERERELARREAEVELQHVAREAEERMALERKEAKEERERMENARKEFEENQERQLAELERERELALLQAAEQREIARRQTEEERAKMEKAQKELEDDKRLQQIELEQERDLIRIKAAEAREAALQEAAEERERERRKEEEERLLVRRTQEKADEAERTRNMEIEKERRLAQQSIEEQRDLERRKSEAKRMKVLEEERRQLHSQMHELQIEKERQRAELERERELARQKAEHERALAAKRVEEEKEVLRRRAEEDKSRKLEEEKLRMDFEMKQLRMEKQILELKNQVAEQKAKASTMAETSTGESISETASQTSSQSSVPTAEPEVQIVEVIKYIEKESEAAGPIMTQEQQALMEESGKIIEFLRNENVRMKKKGDQQKKDFATLKENNLRLMEANTSAGNSFQSLNQHAKQLDRTKKKLLGTIAQYRNQITQHQADMKSRQSYYREITDAYKKETKTRSFYEQTMLDIVDAVTSNQCDRRIHQLVMAKAVECANMSQKVSGEAPSLEEAEEIQKIVTDMGQQLSEGEEEIIQQAVIKPGKRLPDDSQDMKESEDSESTLISL